MDTFQLYKDIQARTNGEIYIGVVGPVRTGKSTFIKRFMDVMVLPRIEDDNVRERTKDELPQSGSGRTITTTEPKFIPKDAAAVQLTEDVTVQLRLIDCVGYMTDGASGHIEDGEERQVKTPWYDHEIPFTKAAGIGTRKVIHDHATIGVVITTDGSVTDIPRDAYRAPEEKTIRELQSIGKPFIILVNSKKPYGEEAKLTAQELQERYDVTAMPVNCEQLKEEDILHILEAVLYEFPILELQFYIPKWVEMLPREHRIKQDILVHIRELMERMSVIKDTFENMEKPDSMYITSIQIGRIGLDNGSVTVCVEIDEKYYYEILSELTNMNINSQYDLIAAIKNLSNARQEYEDVKDAFAMVRLNGYGVVKPRKEEIHLDDPVLIKQGNKFGVKIRSEAPSIHLIRANIETEIAPIVGNEQQAQDLIRYLKDTKTSEGGIWDTNIFGKSVEELVMDGMMNKMAKINEASQEKLQDTMKKIVNDSNGGLVCIII